MEDEHPLRLVREIKLGGVSDEPLSLRLLIPPGHDDWRVAMLSNAKDLFTQCNLKCLLAMLIARAGRDSFRHLVITNHAGAEIGSVVIVRDEDAPVAVAVDCKEMHDNHEHISDEVYWEEVDIHLQRLWTGLTIPERIDYVKRSATDPRAAMLGTVSEEEHTALWTALYQDMEL